MLGVRRCRVQHVRNWYANINALNCHPNNVNYIVIMVKCQVYEGDCRWRNNKWLRHPQFWPRTRTFPRSISTCYIHHIVSYSFGRERERNVTEWNTHYSVPDHTQKILVVNTPNEWNTNDTNESALSLRPFFTLDLISMKIGWVGGQVTYVQRHTADVYKHRDEWNTKYRI